MQTHSTDSKESSLLAFLAGAGAGLVLAHFLCNEDLDKRKEQLTSAARDLSTQMKDKATEKVSEKFASVTEKQNRDPIDHALDRLRQGKNYTKAQLEEIEATLRAQA